MTNVDGNGPTHLGPYRLEQLLGRGGMGEVYRAFDTRRGRTIALKILPAELSGDEGFRARFRRESDNAAKLQDPHVIPTHDFGDIDGRLYIDMRLVEGVSLDQLIAAGPLDPRRAVHLVTQVAEALTDAHSNGVLHRDVKPSNILVTRSDFVYLIDFGIARTADNDLTALTRSGATIGTLAYMAPERFDNAAPDARSDIYSLTCTLAECLTGHRPFNATSLPSLMKAHLTADPPRPSLERPDLPPALDDVIMRGMAKDPAARYPTAQDFAAAAYYATQQWSVPVAPVPPPAAIPAATLVNPDRRPHRSTAALIIGAAVLALAGGGGGFAVGRATAQTAEPPSPPSVASPATSSEARTTPNTVPATPARGFTGTPSTTVAGRSSSWVYGVTSNYSLTMGYTDSNGDQITATNVPAPWTITVATDKWGADAYPVLYASAASSKGDTTVTCTVTDDQGRVRATQTRSAAYASVACSVPS